VDVPPVTGRHIGLSSPFEAAAPSLTALALVATVIFGALVACAGSPRPATPASQSAGHNAKSVPASLATQGPGGRSDPQAARLQNERHGRSHHYSVAATLAGGGNLRTRLPNRTAP
jgi:hypothetical protein